MIILSLYQQRFNDVTFYKAQILDYLLAEISYQPSYKFLYGSFGKTHIADGYSCIWVGITIARIRVRLSIFNRGTPPPELYAVKKRK